MPPVPPEQPHVVPTAPRGAHPAVLLLASASWMVWMLCFKPDPQWWGMVPGFLGLLVLLERAPTTGSFLRWSLLFGALGIGYGYRWLAPTMEVFGGVPPVGAWALTAAFGIVGVVHLWLFAVIVRSLLRGTHRPHPLTVVAAWVACEALVPRMFPWMAGHGFVDVAPVRQAAEWGGVPGVSFVALCLVVPLHELLCWAWPQAGRPPARPGAAAFTLAVGLALAVWGLTRYGE